jgi:DNA-binding PadR family transcriptional regulator
MRNDNPLRDFGRFSEPALLVLVSLAGGAKHGYAMIEDIAKSYGVRLGAGTLYGALSRLEEQGLIAPVASSDRRRPYRLTRTGRSALQAQLGTLRDFVALGIARLRTA